MLFFLVFQLLKDLIRIFCNIIPFATFDISNSWLSLIPTNGFISPAYFIVATPYRFTATIFTPKVSCCKTNHRGNLIYPQFPLVPLSILNSDRVQMRPKSFSMEMQPHVLFFHRFIPQFYGAFLFSVDLIRTRVEPLQARTRQCVSKAQSCANKAAPKRHIMIQCLIKAYIYLFTSS